MKISDTTIHFDLFSSQEEGKHYFLSHFHADHTKGLNRNWRRGKLYASQVTANLLHHITRLKHKYITVVKEFEDFVIYDNGIEYRVTPLPASHCEGALMFLLETKDKKILYTGDFRYNDSFKEFSHLIKDIDIAYIDITFNEPKYVFPSQEECYERIFEIMETFHDNLILIGSYNIGKESIFKAINKKFKTKIYAPPDKFRYYRTMELEDIFTRDKEESRIRTYNMNFFYKYFKNHDNENIIILPTGWAVNRKDYTGKIYHVPYSEHSSYPELMEFVNLINAKKNYDLDGNPISFQQELFV